jgi:SAM-dependent methyltransferase
MSPSIALCRTPELEYASLLRPAERTLDHCCGDGKFASLAWPGRKLSAGCDINEHSASLARSSGVYDRVDVCDAAQRLPYEDDAFDLVFNNSALEHIADLPAALSEIHRVIARDGVLAFNVLNHRYFEWWPLLEEEKAAYRRWQPVFHALSISEWDKFLRQAGFKLLSVQGYFDQRASRHLALLDYSFSSVHIEGPRLSRIYWRRRLRGLNWKTGPDEGAGYFIQAVPA